MVFLDFASQGVAMDAEGPRRLADLTVRVRQHLGDVPRFRLLLFGDNCSKLRGSLSFSENSDAGIRLKSP